MSTILIGELQPSTSVDYIYSVVEFTENRNTESPDMECITDYGILHIVINHGRDKYSMECNMDDDGITNCK